MFWKTGTPAKVPTDIVVPFRYFDDTPLWRSFILYSMFVFDDVLDAVRLRDSLDELVRRDGWHILGARLRRADKGGLEYHIPATFTSERPPISFSHISHATTTANHPIAAQLPQQSALPKTVVDPDTFRNLFQPRGAPTELGHYLNADVPQIGLHVVSFSDKTLVTLYWPHTLMDALGKQAFLKAWIQILENRPSEVIAPIPATTDPLAELGKHPTEPHKLAAQRMSMLQLAAYGWSTISSLFIKKEHRMLCVPASFMKRLHREAYSTLYEETHDDALIISSTDDQNFRRVNSAKEDEGEEEELNTSFSSSEREVSPSSSIISKHSSLSSVSSVDERPFLSDGDVLCAWFTKLAVSHLPASSRRTVCLNNAFTLRKPLAEDLLSGERPYVSNAVGFINVLLPLADVVNKPLGHVASAIRESIKDLGTRAQVEAFTSLWRESSAKLPPFFGNSGMHMITYSNWSKARLFETDFSAAVVATDPTATERRPCKPTYIQNCQFGLCLPNAFPIVGKDNDGNYWLSGYMMKGHWKQIEDQLAQLY